MWNLFEQICGDKPILINNKLATYGQAPPQPTPEIPACNDGLSDIAMKIYGLGPYADEWLDR